MGNRLETSLTEDLLHALQEEHYVTIATVDAEKGGPSVSAVSWIYASDEKTLRLAVDQKSRMIRNVSEEPQAAVTVIAEGSTYTISGRVKVKKESLEKVPLKLSLLEMGIQEVKDVMFYGARLTNEPKFEKTYDEEAAVKLDNQVMEALKRS
ncbi:pyridoxamine 5'-phosphate oxidase family protein [Alkalicoccus urumqiensis]|uniref:Pyridoxamine 5'-phosphate oxidase N-terminal domain-containing protein n=1 Tax=Alkalicoccus urumqiensis TaxID=1548213 RepID=A0A2P6MEP1_ALKUR|nr:pyridoxamine 5'-phosphate oxidase family protein [Alkalicoccus urumqiensis]PRO64759.1 hypothetical protein C6I21_12675 [Alkalicoccus urumqiensis]